MSQQREGRKWYVLSDHYETESDFRLAIENELARLEHVGFRMGRGFICSPLRERNEHMSAVLGTDVYDTLGWVFTETFVPAIRRTAPPDEEPVESDVVSVPAEV